MKKYFIHFFILITLILSSCIPQKKLKYIQTEADKATYQSTVDTTSVASKIQKGDALTIKVFSNNLDLITNSTYTTSNTTTQSSQASLFFQSYEVNDSGYVEFPLLGKYKAEGLTPEELAKNIDPTVKELFTLDAQCEIRVVNFKITLIGEVNSPGVYYISDYGVNIFEAIALSGDMTSYGDRERVVLIRENGDKRTTEVLNLHDANILESPYYELQPNDIIYIEALNAKSFGFDQFQWSLVFSSVSTAIAIIALLSK